MVYILTADVLDERTGNTALARYKAYLATVRDRFPSNAYELAASDWYHDFSDHRCPHDAWLEYITIGEAGAHGEGEPRSVQIVIRLLGAYHHGHIELRYDKVTSYRCELAPTDDERGTGHHDWRYDEFRLSDSGRLLHEIEWCGREDTATWLIESADVRFQWLPRGT